MSQGITYLRTIVQEGIRVQRDSPEPVEYVDAGNVLSDATARQNHVIFGRRSTIRASRAKWWTAPPTKSTHQLTQLLNLTASRKLRRSAGV